MGLDIVMDITNVTTELIGLRYIIVYNNSISSTRILLQGCVPQLVAYFHYILNVIAGVGIIVGVIPIILLVIVVVFAIILIVYSSAITIYKTLVRPILEYALQQSYGTPHQNPPLIIHSNLSNTLP